METEQMQEIKMNSAANDVNHDRLNHVQRRKGVNFDAQESDSSRVSGRKGNKLYPDLKEIDEIDKVELRSASRPNFVLRFVGFVLRLIWSLLRLLFNVSSSPLWTLYHVYMFVTDPFSIKKRFRDYVMRKALKYWYPVSKSFVRYVYARLKEQEILWRLAKQLGWGVVWVMYVCSVMCGLLVCAGLVSGKVVKHVVEKPVWMERSLNFDYTKDSPVAFVPISSFCRGGYCEREDKMSVGLPLIPRNHKMQVGVSVILPESDYNKKLGMFQVQVDVLSSNGETLATMSSPAMLQYKSLSNRLMATLIGLVPLVTGCGLESQALHIRMGRYTEGKLATACFKVMIQGPADVPSGAKVPEIYAASLIIESKYILLKKLLWYAKPLLYTWTAIMFFIVEAFFVLLFFRLIVLPRVAPRGRSAKLHAPQGDVTGVTT